VRTVAVIQARMGSRRLPGKVLEDVRGCSMLARVVRRTRRARRLDEVVVATTRSRSDDRIVEECCALGVKVHRGSEDDVLDRFQRVAEAYAADAVVRITADCPLIDPYVIDDVVEALTAARADYASTTLERCLPRGLDVEAFTADALSCAWREASEPYQRVHVTPYIYENPAFFELFAVAVPAPKGAVAQRWTVDTAEDLALIRALYARLDDDDTFGWRDVLAVVEAEPHLAELNKGVRQRALHEG
jgi:spore coat polysaccharide biosynthesis protein SpsF (cytidylyltransferase family)